ncbi:MAG: hypothetical protein GC155_14625 [Alphaproteobacteria bacterium]|nr:hypothetical protein [Alphaproteobacteria bacterium]
MIRQSIRAIALAAVACALPACSQGDARDGATTPAVTSAKRAAMPDCGTAQAVDNGTAGWTHPDCRLLSTDSRGLNFDVHYGPAADGADGRRTPVSIAVVPAGDATIQTITETVGNTFSAPSLEDIDGDAFAELLVPLETGNVNTTYAIWYAPPGGKHFTRLGEVSAVGFHKTVSGYIAAPARSSANQWAVQFFKLTPDAKLKPVLTANVTARGEPDHITGIDCQIEDAGGLRGLKLNPVAAKTAFCAESVVQDVFK